MQCPTGGRWLAAVDHAAAGLNGQLSLEGKVSPLVITEVALGTKTKIFDLQVNDDDVVVIELQKIYVAMFDAGHLHGNSAGVLYAHNQSVGAGAGTVRRIAAFAETIQIHRLLAQLLGALCRSQDVRSPAVCRHDAVKQA